LIAHAEPTYAYDPTRSDAWISDCERYRYRLRRPWSDDPSRALWIMLNPSTADARDDDATIRRCISFSKRWGMGGLVVVNLFAWRSTDPDAMFGAIDDTIGPDNAKALEAEIRNRRNALIVCAWGTHRIKRYRERIALRAFAVRALIRRSGRGAACLGRTKDGQPRHPCRLEGETALEAYPVA
jgi:hypothetical protein